MLRLEQSSPAKKV